MPRHPGDESPRGRFSDYIAVRLTPSAREMVEAAAMEQKKSIAQYIRDVLAREAARSLHEGSTSEPVLQG
jgi:predicted HicB family RNase H-like nuclease